MFLSLEFGFRFAWGSHGYLPGQFSGPQGIAVDSSGNVYVADTQNQRVQKFDYSGNYLSEIAGIGYPLDVAVDASGNVYIADGSNNQILKYDSSFTHTASLGSSGNGDYQFQTPSGVTLDPSDQYLYVVDNGNCRIMKFDTSLANPGSYLKQWGKLGTEHGQFNGPVKLAADLFGSLYVTDSGNNRIQKFNSSVDYVSMWGSKGSGAGEFDGPMGIAAGGLVYDPPPDERPPVPSRGFYAYIIVADSSNNRCQLTGVSGDQFGSLAGQFGSSGSKEGQFKGPVGVAVRDYIYVVDRGNNRVQAFTWGWSRSDL
jgi:tripartite motif-containing protein 71